MIFLDGKFNTCPRSFYQLLNIVGYLADKDITFPVMSCILTSKTERIYDYTLVEFKKLVIKFKYRFFKIKIYV